MSRTDLFVLLQVLRALLRRHCLGGLQVFAERFVNLKFSTQKKTKKKHNLKNAKIYAYKTLRVVWFTINVQRALVIRQRVNYAHCSACVLHNLFGEEDVLADRLRTVSTALDLLLTILSILLNFVKEEKRNFFIYINSKSNYSTSLVMGKRRRTAMAGRGTSCKSSLSIP